jgi:hypothetical protein
MGAPPQGSLYEPVVEHLKRVLMEECPPENIKGEDPLQEDHRGVWKYLDNSSHVKGWNSVTTE